MFEKGSDLHDKFKRLFVSNYDAARDESRARFKSCMGDWFVIESSIHDLDADYVEYLTNQSYFIFLVLSLYSAFHFTIKGTRWEKVEFCRNIKEFIVDVSADDLKFIPYLNITTQMIDANNQSVTDPDFSELFELFAGSIKQEDLDAYFSRDLDIFSPIYQEIFTNDQKHASGEHFTPIALCRFMVEQIPVTSRSRILDPSCGAGAFVVSVIEKLKIMFSGSENAWRDNVNGYDINPVSVLATRVNAWMAFNSEFLEIKDLFKNFRVADVLREHIPLKFDIIIGNPPWVTLKDFSSKERKSEYLTISKELGIMPGPHEVPQLELSALMFQFCLVNLLTVGGMIFFILTSSVLNGRHCSLFRNFFGAREVRIWHFKGPIGFPKTFNCISAWKSPSSLPHLKPGGVIPAFSYLYSKTGFEKSMEFSMVAASTTPVRRESRGSGMMIGRLVPEEEANFLLRTSELSHYKRLCYNGATVFPQSLLFVKIIDQFVESGVDMVKIIPSPVLNSKKPWNAVLYPPAVVEKHYIFKLLKGSELYPFGTLKHHDVFLPMLRKGGAFRFIKDDEVRSTERAITHYDAINQMYKDYANTSGRIKNLWDRINFDNELLNGRMFAPYKVIFPDCGSIMAAAVVAGDVIIEHALHYIGLDDEDEAYYLAGVLNSRCIADDLAARKSERHIGQIALDYHIPPYRNTNPSHCRISQISKDLHDISKKSITSYIQDTITDNIGRLQCPASLKFIKESQLPKHESRCIKFQRFKGMIDEYGLLIKVSRHNIKEIVVKPSRAKLKKILESHENFRRLADDLNQLVLKLLE
ncbi:MAG: N-6 DNA methylase [Promethearchaeota archaeon]